MILSNDQVTDLLYYLGASKVVDRGNSIQFTCVVHGESRPSAGVYIYEGIQMYHCFSCGSKGDLAWLVYKSSDDFKHSEEAKEWICKRYNIDYKKKGTIKRRIPRYGEYPPPSLTKDMEILPRKTLAPYKCGKETYKYFFERGFDKNTLEEFNVGRDLESQTVVVPVYNYNKDLVGMIGRYIDPNREMHERYRVYSFNRGALTFPQNKLEVIDDTIILVEGLFDAIYLHILGFKNTQAILGNRITKEQAKFLKTQASKFILFFDNDKGGQRAIDFAKEILKGDMMYTIEYPQGVKDPCDLDMETINYMLKTKNNIFRNKIKRI